jgi:hypothetical protein
MDIRKPAIKVVSFVGAGFASLNFALAELIDVSLVGDLGTTGVGILALLAFCGFVALVADFADYVVNAL